LFLGQQHSVREATKKIKNLIYLYPPALNFFASFPKALGASRPFFKLLGVTKVRGGKSVKRYWLTIRRFELPNTGYSY